MNNMNTTTLPKMTPQPLSNQPPKLPTTADRHQKVSIIVTLSIFLGAVILMGVGVANMPSTPTEDPNQTTMTIKINDGRVLEVSVLKSQKEYHMNKMLLVGVEVGGEVFPPSSILSVK